MQERKTTMGDYHWTSNPEQGGGLWYADDPVAPEGEGWRLEGAGMSQGTFAWFWVRDLPLKEALR